MKMSFPDSTYKALNHFGLIGLVGAQSAALAVVAQSSFGAPPAIFGAKTASGWVGKSVPASDDLRQSEKRFFERAFQMGLRQMRVASIALERAEHPEVIAAAWDLSGHHEKMTGELAQIASSYGCDVEPLVSASEPVAQLVRISETDFQSVFLSTVTLQQENLVALFEDGGRGLNDAELRSFAIRQLTVMLNDLSQVENLKRVLV